MHKYDRLLNHVRWVTDDVGVTDGWIAKLLVRERAEWRRKYGAVDDPKEFPIIINVAKPEDYPDDDIQLPFGFYNISKKVLNEFRTFTDLFVRLGYKVVVHCDAAEERSVLAAYWWLRGQFRQYTDEDIWAHIVQSVPSALDRRDWIEK